jgi:hypothetical protein
MSNKSNVCPKCKKACKDKRGLTLHMKSCQGVIDLTCSFCNNTFANSYTLAVHVSRCNKSKQYQEEQDQILKNEIAQLQDKLKEQEQKHILVTKEQEQKHMLETKELKFKHNQEVKDIKKYMRTDFDSQLKLRDDDLASFHKQLESLKKEIQDKDQKNTQLTQSLNDRDVSNRVLIDLVSKISLKESNHTTTIINDNRIQLQCLDPSMIQGRINPPEYAIGNVNDFVGMLRSLGVRNCFRINDKARGTLRWNKPGEGEIRDPNGDQLLTHIIDTLEDDITHEKCYYEAELKKLSEKEDPNLYQINESHIFINFCTQLLRKDPEILKKIKRELIRQGKSKDDHEVDRVYEISFNKLVTSILTALFPNILVWIEKSFYELGQFLAPRIRNHFHLEGASLHSLYIVVHTDNNTYKQVNAEKLMSYISEAIDIAIDSDLTEKILHELLLYKADNIEKVKFMLDYLHSPTLEQTQDIMRGIIAS